MHRHHSGTCFFMLMWIRHGATDPATKFCLSASSCPPRRNSAVPQAWQEMKLMGLRGNGGPNGEVNRSMRSQAQERILAGLPVGHWERPSQLNCCDNYCNLCSEKKKKRLLRFVNQRLQIIQSVVGLNHSLKPLVLIRPFLQLITRTSGNICLAK